MKVTDQFGMEFSSLKELRSFYKIPANVEIKPTASKSRIVPDEYIKAANNSKDTAEAKHIIDDSGDVVTITRTEYNKMKQDIAVYREYAESLDVDLQTLRDKLYNMQIKNDNLMAMFNASHEEVKEISIAKTEDDYYPDETINIIYIALTKMLANIDIIKQGRQYDIITDLLSNISVNKGSKHIEDMELYVRNNIRKLKSNMDVEIFMETLGFVKQECNGHIKYLWHNDERYAVTVASTPSDYRSMNNTVHDALNKIFGTA